MNKKQISFLMIFTTCIIVCHLSMTGQSGIEWQKLFYFKNLNYICLFGSGILFLLTTLSLRLLLANFEKIVHTFKQNLMYAVLVVCSFICFTPILLLNNSWNEAYEDYVRCFFATIYCGIAFVIFLMLIGHDEVDFANSQNDQCSIGAYWATGATQTYYERCLSEFQKRVREFEANNPDMKLFVKKLILIAPLSCNIEGSLSDKDEKIHYKGQLEPIECDVGANINRHLITSIYEIENDRNIFVAAEFPSPLGTLWGERHRMDESVRIYIRDCFLKELKEQLKFYPVIILKYDDLDPSKKVPLHHFIMSSLKQYLEEDRFYL